MKEAKFLEIYKILKQQIIAGEYAIGTPFPSLSVLMDRFSTSRPTICKTLKRLEESNFISTQNGVGSIVTDPESQKNEKENITIGVDLFSLSMLQYYNMGIMQGFRRAADLHGFNIQAFLVHSIKEWEALKNPPDGVILSFIEKNQDSIALCDRLIEQKIPIMLVNRNFNNPNIGEIVVDYRKEACRAVSLFIKSGLKKIALFAEFNKNTAMYYRALGWRDAYIENNLPVPEELVIKLTTFPEACKSLVNLLDCETPDMIFTANESCFSFAYSELCKRQLHASLPMLCFDDISSLPTYDTADPTSFIRMPLTEMGFLAAQDIYQRITTPDTTKVFQKVVDADLIVRR